MSLTERVARLELELDRLRHELSRAPLPEPGEVEAPQSLLGMRVRGARIAIDLARSVEVVRMVAATALAERSPSVLGVIDYRGTVVPLLDIAVELGLAPRRHGLDSKIVVALALGRPVGLVVDEVDGLLEAAPGTYEPRSAWLPGHEKLASRRWVCGTLRSEEALTLVMDLDRLAWEAPETAPPDGATAVAGRESAPAAGMPTADPPVAAARAEEASPKRRERRRTGEGHA